MSTSVHGRIRRALRHTLDDAAYAWQLRYLPARVALVQMRARLLARRGGDTFSLVSATRPRDLARLLKLAQGRRRLVELGTGTGWTTLALAVDDPCRRIVSFDPCDRPERHRYLALADARTRARIELVPAPGAAGPRSSEPVELLYVDSSHERAETIAELNAWMPVLAPGALVIFDDYGHTDYPGVREAVQELGLSGQQCGTLFVHHRAK